MTGAQIDDADDQVGVDSLEVAASVVVHDHPPHLRSVDREIALFDASADSLFEQVQLTKLKLEEENGSYTWW